MSPYDHLLTAGIMKWNHLIARASMIERPELNKVAKDKNLMQHKPQHKNRKLMSPSYTTLSNAVQYIHEPERLNI